MPIIFGERRGDVRRAAAGLALALLAGCGYARDRARDAADIFTAEAAVGVGLHVDAKATDHAHVGLGCAPPDGNHAPISPEKRLRSRARTASTSSACTRTSGRIARRASAASTPSSRGRRRSAPRGRARDAGRGPFVHEIEPGSFYVYRLEAGPGRRSPSSWIYVSRLEPAPK